MKKQKEGQALWVCKSCWMPLRVSPERPALSSIWNISRIQSTWLFISLSYLFLWESQLNASFEKVNSNDSCPYPWFASWIHGKHTGLSGHSACSLNGCRDLSCTSKGICLGHIQSTEDSAVIALSDLFCSWFKQDYELRLNCTSL